MQIHHFADTAQLNQAFAAELTQILTDAIALRGAAYLVVSGGKTPQALFTQLAGTMLDWSKVTILLADDRWLPPSDKDSNEGLVKQTLLQQHAAKAQFISLHADSDSAFSGITQVLPRLEALPVFDAVILGMGEDGHTASLFPCSEQIQQGLADDAPVALAVKPQTAPYERVSLSKPRLLKSRKLFLHLVGANKLQVLNKAMSSQDVLTMPIRAFLQHPQADVAVMYTEK